MRSFFSLEELSAIQNLLTRRNLLVLLCLQISLLLSGCDSEFSTAHAADVKTYPSVSVRQISLQSTYEIDREFMGVVQAPQRIDLGFDSAGALVDMLVEEGDWVERGQKLAVLDSLVLQAELSSAKAAKRDLNARLALNKKDLARQEKLREKNYASESQRDTLASQQQSFRAQIQSASASVQSLERQIAKKSLYAPFSAHVAARLVDKGVVVSPGSPIVQLLESGALLARVGVPVPMARKMVKGKEYDLLVESESYRARLRSLGNSVNRASKTVAAEFEILEIDESKKLFDGQIIRLILNEERVKQGAWVSVDSLVAAPKGTWDVYVLAQISDKDAAVDGVDLKMVERRKVNVEYIGGGGAYISYGLSSGDLVIDTGIQKIAAHQLVKIGRTIKVANTNSSL